MLNTFEKALAFTLKWEGGYSNHPNDKGGPTNFGITQNTYDKYLLKNLRQQKSVKYITPQEVSDIYKNLYWEPIDSIIRPEDFAIAAFDFAVNSGVSRAIQFLPGCMNATEYIDKREDFLKSIGVGHNSVFLKGWLNRINALREYIKDLGS